MGEVIPFRRPKPGAQARGRTLCREGFHKWVIDTSRRFDVKSGKLVTTYRCSRCDARKTTT